MRIEIQTKDVKTGQNFKHALKVKIRKMFLHNSHKIRLINITLRDVNGPKGGEDKLCKVNIFVEGGKHILVSVKEISAYKAAIQAIRKANSTFYRQLGKAKTFKHSNLSDIQFEPA